MSVESGQPNENETVEGSSMRLKFWGVRGSIPTPAASHLEHGGNTPCVELRSADGTVCLFDAGSGLRGAGQALVQEFGDRLPTANVFLSHYHWDHIQGIPFFAPMYGRKHNVAFRAAGALGKVRSLLWGQMSTPYFPVNLGDLVAQHSFEELDGPLKVGSVIIHPFALNHPQGSFGYRVEADNKVFVYACDHEHGNQAVDTRLREFAQGADLLICDAQYTPEEYQSRRGWGHGTWKDSTAVARDAGARQLVLFHHDPDHDDECLRRIAVEAGREFENTIAGREGCVVEL
jgi:phosphoribosyl 1,2-cyclic phosphodiesterase